MISAYLSRCLRAFMLFSAILLGACKPKPGEHRQPPAQALAKPVMDTAVIQMSGLLLIVPSHYDGKTTVVLPNSPSDIPHRALLGFGMPPDSAWAKQLCWKREKGLCYVDLGRWTVDSLGAGGTPTSRTSLGRFAILNVSSLSGQHPLTTTGVPRRREVVLASGNPDSVCSLAWWTMKPYGSNSAMVDTLANVLYWRITWPASSPFTMIFHYNQWSDTVDITPGPSGKIHLLLVNIPEDEEQYLPPSTATPDPAEHKEAQNQVVRYYDHVRDVRGTPDTADQRRFPVFSRPTGHACRISISASSRGYIDQNRSFGTYACMPASGTPP